jgi:hypothetical protein
MQAMLSQLNQRFSPEELGSTKGRAEGLTHATPLDELAGAFGAGTSRFAKAFLKTWPKSIQTAVAAVVTENLRRAVPLPITFAWAPGYDFELQVSEAPGTRQSPGGITVLLRSRYPGDVHPARPAK